jgi:hypothetical protein
MGKFSTMETAAHRYFEILREKRALTAFCGKRGLVYSSLSNCVFKRRREDGLWGYRTRPAYRLVKSLREILHPDLWYVFPDELRRYRYLTVEELLGAGNA